MRTKLLSIAVGLLAQASVFGQNVIVDRQPNFTTSINATYGSDDVFLASADSFTLSNKIAFGQLSVYGQFWAINGDPTQTLEGVNIYIYKNDNNFNPAGFPDHAGTALYEIKDIPMSAVSIEQTPGTSDQRRLMKIPVTQVNGGNQVVLEPGTYWLVVMGKVNGSLFSYPNVNIWFWEMSNSTAPLPPKLYDPSNLTGLGFTGWKTMGEIVGYGVPGLAWALTDEAILGTNEIQKSQISIYPNPVTDIINISLPAQTEIKSVQLVDFSGRNIPTTMVSNKIDVSQLQPGTYILNLKTNKGDISKKIVKK